MIIQLHLQKFLSFGPDSKPIDFHDLNVIIGPNGSGKSNLLEAIAVLRTLPNKVNAAFARGGGFSQFVWKGKDVNFFQFTVQVALENTVETLKLRHFIEFQNVGQGTVRQEIIEEDFHGSKSSLYNFTNHKTKGIGTQRGKGGLVTQYHTFENDPEYWNESALREIRDFQEYPEITSLGRAYEAIRLYREFNFASTSPVRQFQPADLPSDFLSENASNLALVLNDLQQRAASRQKIRDYLQKFNPQFENVNVKVGGGMAQLSLEEKKMNDNISAIRLSDGTLQWLCLLAILCHPKPPKLICIEEPETGLHPDAMTLLARLLKDASQRTQIIVTTHSEALVAALSDVPETVLVCERDENGTQMRRLDAPQLEKWLEKYTLGDLWRMGEIGGTL